MEVWIKCEICFITANFNINWKMDVREEGELNQEPGRGIQTSKEHDISKSSNLKRERSRSPLQNRKRYSSSSSSEYYRRRQKHRHDSYRRDDRDSSRRHREKYRSTRKYDSESSDSSYISDDSRKRPSKK